MSASKIIAVGKANVVTEGTDSIRTSVKLGEVMLPNGKLVQVKRAFVTATSNATTELVPQVADAAIRVLCWLSIGGGTAPTVTLQSYDGSTDTAISPPFPLAANGGFSLAPNPYGWFQTLAINTALRVTVSNSSDVGIIVNYLEIPQDCFDLL